MKERFLKVAQEGHFFDKHKKVLIALSGGIDSMNLFYLLYEYQKQLGIILGIAHVNHGQRLESNNEEAYLKQIATQYGVPFYISHFEGVFSEATARRWRYDFFKKVMVEEGYTALVTAHHTDDQVETIFMRVIRGNRLRHLSGIKMVQPFATGELIRPLLSFRKSDLDNVFHFEDSSNKSMNYFRNRVRNHYLPQLKKENPKIESALSHIANETSTLFQALRDLTQNIDITDISIFQRQTESVQAYLLEEYLEKFPDLQLSRSQFNQLLHILRSKANYFHTLKNGYRVEKDYKTFCIKKIQLETDRQLNQIMIKSRGTFSYGSYTFSLNESLADADHILYFPETAPIVLRNRQAGDKMIIQGIHKKIRRWFIDQKVPQNLRREAIIIEQMGEIYGIANLVSSDLSKSAKNGIIKATLYIKMRE
ncbi:tRNA lysidine(34) synthetase TilS [Streptococcus suis]|nr:tRNA lysidine(34) synthetase TilS [Streptococcus suis]